MDLSSYLDIQEGELEHAALGEGQTENQFADGGNYRVQGQFINHQLSVYGFPCPIDFDFPAVEDRVRVLNTLYLLLADKQASMRNREELQDRIHRLTVTKNDLEIKVNQLRDRFQQADNDLHELENRRRREESESRLREKKLKTDLALLNKQYNMLVHRDNQYRHEMRKRELEVQKLQEKLASGLQANRGVGKSSLEMVNTLNRQLRPKWKSAKGEEEMYEQIVTGYQNRVNELISENQQLRDSLRNLQQQLQTVLDAAANKPTSPELLEKDMEPASWPAAARGGSPAVAVALDDVQAAEGLLASVDYGALQPAQLELPYDLVREDFEQQIHTRIQQLAQKMGVYQEEKRAAAEQMESSQRLVAHLQQQHDAPHLTSTLQKLIHTLKEYQGIIEEQDLLLRSSLFSASSAPHPDNDHFVRESRRLSMDAEAEWESERLRSQIEQLQKENQALMQAALTAQQQVDALENEKQNVEAAKLAVRQQHRIVKALSNATFASLAQSHLNSPLQLSPAPHASTSTSTSSPSSSPFFSPASSRATLASGSPSHLSLASFGYPSLHVEESALTQEFSDVDQGKYQYDQVHSHGLQKNLSFFF